jgi:hypothetical protein
LGVPQVANDGTAGGLSRDGRVVALARWDPRPQRAMSRFLIVSTRSFRIWRRITLKGNFAFDALSPGARTLYLIEQVSANDLTRYRVRAYDLALQRLLPRVVADRRQASWTMQGYPLTRAASADARWVYTLYQQPGGYPFVHALDSVGRTAVCIGLPWRGNRDIAPTLHLRLDHGPPRLLVETRRGRALFAIDTRTYWVSRPRTRQGAFLARRFCDDRRLGRPREVDPEPRSAASVLASRRSSAASYRSSTRRPRPDDLDVLSVRLGCGAHSALPDHLTHERLTGVDDRHGLTRATRRRTSTTKVEQTCLRISTIAATAGAR